MSSFSATHKAQSTVIIPITFADSAVVYADLLNYCCLRSLSNCVASLFVYFACPHCNLRAVIPNL
jgi:hypothetical protein